MIFGVLKMKSRGWSRKFVWECEGDDAYHTAKIVAVGDLIGDEVKVGDEVLVEKSDWWQFYRVDGSWFFVSDIVNLLGVRET